jgi:hypothetical protein
MPRSVTLTTPIPTLEELRTSLGVSKARQRVLLRIMNDGNPARSAKSTNGRGTGMVESSKSRKNTEQRQPAKSRVRKSARASSSR